MKRTFSKEEAQRIFADAAERQQAGARHTDEHLTLEELEDAAVAAGIDPAYVRAAAELLVRPGHTGTERRILGMPLEYRRSSCFPSPSTTTNGAGSLLNCEVYSRSEE